MIFNVYVAPCNTGLENGKFAKLARGLLLKTTAIINHNEIFADFWLPRYFITLENKLADQYKKLFDRPERINAGSRNFKSGQKYIFCLWGSSHLL